MGNTKCDIVHATRRLGLRSADYGRVGTFPCNQWKMNNKSIFCTRLMSDVGWL